MANSERVSQLIELPAVGIRGEDLLLVTDMNERESKKTQIGEFLLYIQNSGSFNAATANLANTASYIESSNIDGIVALSTIASQSISSSLSEQSISSSWSLTSSYAITSSWAEFALTTAGTLTTADTASFLDYTGTPNGTASYSMRSLLADTSSTSLNLSYNGTPNGTASFSISSSNSKISDTASYGDSFQIWHPDASAATYGILTMYGGVSDALSIRLSGSSDNGIAYFRTQDDGTEPFLFQSWNSNGGFAPVDRVKISYSSHLYGSALMTVYGQISASIYNASYSGVGFVGTASNAISSSHAVTASYTSTASYVSSAGSGPKFMVPVIVYSSYLSAVWTTFNCSAYVPTGTKVVILDYSISPVFPPAGSGELNIRSDVLSPTYVFTAFYGVTPDLYAGQGIFPIIESGGVRSFDFEITQITSLATIRLIGYY